MLNTKPVMPQYADWKEGYLHSVTAKEKRYYLELSQEDATETGEVKAFREEVFQFRHQSEKGLEKDVFMEMWLRLQYVRNNVLESGRPRRYRKEMAAIEEGFRFAQGLESAQKQQVLYEEYLNLMRIYVDTCQSDRSYRGVIFRIGKMKEGNLMDKIAQDLTTALIAVPEMFQSQETFHPLQKAARAAFLEYYPNQEALWAAYAKE